MKMTKFFKLTVPFLGFVFMSNMASASLLIEPHLGYNVHASGTSTESSVSHDYSYSGGEYGMRVGYQQLGLMAGLDFTHSTLDLDDKKSSGTTNTSFDRNEFGVFAGYNFPIMLRAWAAFYFKSKANANNNDYFKGNSTELGVGFTALPFLSVNAMYRIVSWDEHKTSAGTVGTSLSTNEIVLGVSLPINL